MSSTSTVENKVTVSLKFGDLSAVTEWCDIHCGAEWKFGEVTIASSANGTYEFCFDDNRDSVLFIMRWV